MSMLRTGVWREEESFSFDDIQDILAAANYITKVRDAGYDPEFDSWHEGCGGKIYYDRKPTEEETERYGAAIIARKAAEAARERELYERLKNKYDAPR